MHSAEYPRNNIVISVPYPLPFTSHSLISSLLPHHANYQLILTACNFILTSAYKTVVTRKKSVPKICHFKNET